MTFNPTPFSMLRALVEWGLVFGIFLLLAMAVVLLTSFVVKGVRGPLAVSRLIGSAVREMLGLSPRRVMALAGLTFRESIRRKALLVFVVFAILFMFAGWFLSDSGARDDLQLKVYISFVLRTLSWLILPVVLLLSCWGLPEDIRLRSLHTVVTKPARRNEIVLGRMLGFGMIGTVLLLLMGSVGYIWLLRNLPDTAREKLTCRVPIYGDLRFVDREGNQRDRGINTGDIWEFRSYIEGATKATAVWEFDNITPERVLMTDTDTGEEALKLESRFESFRTHKGDMKSGLICRFFLSNPLRTNVADALKTSDVLEDSAVSIVSGQFDQVADSLDEIAEEIADKSLRLSPREYRDMSEAFNVVAQVTTPLAAAHAETTWLGQFNAKLKEAADTAADSNRAGSDLPQSLQELSKVLRENASSAQELIVDWRVPHRPFEVSEYRSSNLNMIPRTLPYDRDGVQTEVDLFKEIVHDGRLRVEVQCLDQGQLIGMARPDLFLRTPDRPFWVGYCKALFSAWLMIVLIVVVGVAASCFLKGPVATLLTVAFLVVGNLFRGFLDRLLSGELEGSGTIESVIRMVRHMNPTSELTVGSSTGAIHAFDQMLAAQLWLANWVIPDFGHFTRTTEFVANGFDVPWSAGILPCLATTFGFIIPCLVIGHFSLKLRELEAK